MMMPHSLAPRLGGAYHSTNSSKILAGIERKDKLLLLIRVMLYPVGARTGHVLRLTRQFNITIAPVQNDPSTLRAGSKVQYVWPLTHGITYITSEGFTTSIRT